MIKSLIPFLTPEEIFYLIGEQKRVPNSLFPSFIEFHELPNLMTFRVLMNGCILHTSQIFLYRTDWAMHAGTTTSSGPVRVDLLGKIGHECAELDI